MSPLIAGSGTNQPSNRQHHQQGVNIAHSTPTPPPHNSIHSSNRGWSSICLRPTPPLRPCLALGTSPNGPYSRYSRKPMSYKEDGLILDVIEAYCSLAKPRSTVNSVELLTGGNVQMHDKLTRSHRSSLDLIRSSSTVIMQPHNYRPHAQRASTWCCGSLVLRQLHNT